ncbi:MAG TPA: DUF4058 family protein [Isosphaeraceae bacterium]|nr:DUF4058 family protein [Isosphaeraceae bacterium]
MPSPFPGMDPYLENPEIFPDVHDSLITYLRAALQARLPEPYIAVLGRRVWIEVSHLVVKVAHDEFREPFIEIRVRHGDGQRLVASIEVLSPANKSPGEHGRELYKRKQKEILASQVHLVEIDFLRGGEPTTAVPLDLAREACGPFDYHVSIHGFDDLETYHVYPIRLEDRLPPVDIPLLPGDAAVTVDLQAVFDRCYEEGPYAREIGYGVDAVIPPLRPDQAAWAAQVLQAAPG